jgi:hypothetical protein
MSEGLRKLSVGEQIVFDGGQLDAVLAVVATGNDRNIPYSLLDQVESRAKRYLQPQEVTEDTIEYDVSEGIGEYYPQGTEYAAIALRSLGRIQAIKQILPQDTQDYFGE